MCTTSEHTNAITAGTPPHMPHQEVSEPVSPSGLPVPEVVPQQASPAGTPTITGGTLGGLQDQPSPDSAPVYRHHASVAGSGRRQGSIKPMGSPSAPHESLPDGGLGHTDARYDGDASDAASDFDGYDGDDESTRPSSAFGSAGADLEPSSDLSDGDIPSAVSAPNSDGHAASSRTLSPAASESGSVMQPDSDEELEPPSPAPKRRAAEDPEPTPRPRPVKRRRRLEDPWPEDVIAAREYWVDVAAAQKRLRAQAVAAKKVVLEEAIKLRAGQYAVRLGRRKRELAAGKHY